MRPRLRKWLVATTGVFIVLVALGVVLPLVLINCGGGSGGIATVKTLTTQP